MLDEIIDWTCDIVAMVVVTFLGVMLPILGSVLLSP